MSNQLLERREELRTVIAELKEELSQKLDEFASTTDNLEEIFENREQIEVSRFSVASGCTVMISAPALE